MRRYVAMVLSSVLALQAAPLFVASAASAAPAVRAGGVQAPVGGIIMGTAKNADGQVLPRQGLQLRNLDTAAVVATTTSNDRGAYSFARVEPANYVVELVDSKTGAIVGTSAAMAIAAGTTTTMTVAASTALVQGAAVAGGAAGAGGAVAGGAAAGGAAAGGAAAAGAGAAAAAGGVGIGVSTALVVASVAVAAGVAGVVVVARDNPSPSN